MRILKRRVVASLALLAWILGAFAGFQGLEESTALPSQDSPEVYRRVYNGWKWWHVYCYRCHGVNALGTPQAPNLTNPLLTYEEFLQKGSNGAPENGMPAWNKLLDDEQITDIYIYVRARSEKLLPPGRPDEVGPNGGPWIPPEGWAVAVSTSTAKPPESEAVPPASAEMSGDVSLPRVYVANEASGDVSVIDTVADRVIATIPVGKHPRGIQVSPDRKTVYVTLSGSPLPLPSARQNLPPADKPDGIGVIDVLQNQLVKIIPGGPDPERLVISRDGSRLYVINPSAASTSVVDLASGNVIQTIPVGKEPKGLAMSPDGKIVYVTHETSRSVSVIETETNKVIATLMMEGRPRAAAFQPDGSRAYVTTETFGFLSVVDTENYRVTDTIKLEGDNVRLLGVAVAPDGKRIYVSTGNGGRVLAIDTSTHQVVASFEVGEYPWRIAITPDGRKLYTANGASDDVSVVDVGTLQVVARIKVGKRPWGVAIVP